MPLIGVHSGEHKATLKSSPFCSSSWVFLDAIYIRIHYCSKKDCRGQYGSNGDNKIEKWQLKTFLIPHGLSRCLLLIWHKCCRRHDRLSINVIFCQRSFPRQKEISGKMGISRSAFHMLDYKLQLALLTTYSILEIDNAYVCNFQMIWDWVRFVNDHLLAELQPDRPEVADFAVFASYI